MAVAGTITKLKSGAMATEIVITGVTGGNTSANFSSEMLPYGTAELVLASGTAPTSVQLQGSNDGSTFVNLGAAVTTFPAVVQLGVALAAPMKFYQIALTGGDGTTQFSAFVILMGVRG